MKQWIAAGIFAGALWMGCAKSLPPQVPVVQEMGEQVTSLRSPSGIHLQLMRWGAAEQQEALLLFSGLRHPWAGKVQLHKVQTCRAGQCYSTEVNGRRWTTLLLGKESAELYLPFMEVDTPTSLSYAAEAEGTLKPEELAKMFEGQKRE